MSAYSPNPDAIAKFREQTKTMLMSNGCSQLCRKCGKVKATAGGRRAAALPGAITRYNPLRFTCAACLSSALQSSKATDIGSGADIARPVAEANGSPAEYRDGASADVGAP